MIRKKIKKIINDSCKKLIKSGKLGKNFIDFCFDFEPSPKSEYGDYTTKIYKITEQGKRGIRKGWRTAGENMENFSEKESEFIEEEIKKSKDFRKIFKNIEFKPPVFFNWFLSEEYLQKQLGIILGKKEEFGSLKIGRKRKVNVEFISANPTGPLTLGNGRGGFCGDVLANVLRKAGYRTTKEYYINDVGGQIKKLGHSVIGDSEAVYKGEYIKELRKKIKGTDAGEVGEKAAKIILKEMIKPSVKKMGIKFDIWFSERSLSKGKKIDKILNWLEKKKLTYKKKDALWFRSTKFGDDKDRVLVKADGEKTYFASDIAYLKNKFERGFKKLIFFWGADHYGYVKRMQASLKALGYKKEQGNFIIMQLVRLFEEGHPVKMSKRTGAYVTIEELIDKIGLDIVRFFFLVRNPGSHLNFDLTLAKERSEKNPVFYIQYAYARICAILRKCGKLKTASPRAKKLKLLNHPSELALIRQLIKFPEVIERTAKDYHLQRIPRYAFDLAAAFHQFYRDCQVLKESKEIAESRIALIKATKIVIKNTLDLMKISTPSRM